MFKWYVCNIKHKIRIFILILNFCIKLIHRGITHDNSKFSKLEATYFSKYVEKLKSTTYGSEEYYKMKAELSVALEHHYQNNRHHPEHFPNNDYSNMDLIDLVEMYCDWCVASKNEADGEMRKSIDHNRRRFNMAFDLVEIFKNTEL